MKNESKPGMGEGMFTWPEASTKPQSLGQSHVEIRLWLLPKVVCMGVGREGVSMEGGRMECGT